MTNSGDAAEQVVRLSLEGTEVALRLTGSAAKNIAAALYTIYKDRDTRKIKGQQKLTSMLKSGKELKVFTITDKNLKTFAKEANRYGVVYCALRGKENDADHMVDILARAEDASKINRIVERFNLSAVDSASIKEEIIKDKSEKANVQKDDEDIIVDEMLSKPTQKDEPEVNPFGAEMENGGPSEPSLTQPKKEEKRSNTKSFFEKKTSVREKLREIIESRRQKKDEPEKTKEPEEIKKKPETKEIRHEQPKHRKKKKQKTESEVIPMSDYDEIIESKSKPKENHFPKKDWKAEKNNLFETANNAAVDTVYSGKNLRKYLETQSRFDKYSATNVLLIMSQKPEATQIKDYNSWQKAGVTVKKFEKSFSILEPGKEYKTESGEIRQNFNIKKMFDISQTTAEPEEKPEVHVDEKLLLKALIHKSPVPIQMADHLDFNRGAFYDHEKETLFVLRGMSAPDIFRSVSKELAFAELAKTRSDYRRSECEFPAYCASFILCQKNGIDTKDYDFSRIPESIRSKEPAQIRAQLGEIRETAVNIMERMNKVLLPEKVPKTKEQER